MQDRDEYIRRVLKLYFIMGSANCRLSPAETLTQAINGGITLFQFREKGPGALTGAAAVRLGRQLQAVCRAHGIPFIVNDDIGLAETLDADGVHVGQEDEPAGSIRRRLGTDKIVGVSAHTPEEARQAIADGADYLGVGPVYPTSSKDDARAVQGTQVIEQLRLSGFGIPLVGIGGITADNVAPVIRAGADGISVISAISAAAEVKEAASRLLNAVRL
ncbi:thiamine phosphate synthase [Paenibacillus camerounensis]|uniref:thiamine phosphate synthase n=1 Tax=Paenibacillus camerounensis TaxID=1243663 RepID=UPI0005A82DDE|nr:thiamine phosphate synthase [Paenibacillus camerounensis]